MYGMKITKKNTIEISLANFATRSTYDQNTLRVLIKYQYIYKIVARSRGYSLEKTEIWNKKYPMFM